ncbi:MAG: hypothetical protein H0U57_04985 [Tatlockia sp.]|nr:hypothetical protein [Tatlockia sp.]
MSMLVRRIKEFIKSLSTVKDKLGKYDLEFYRKLEDKFVKNQKNEECLNRIEEVIVEINFEERALTGDELAWMEELFLIRWQSLANAFDDYNFYKGGEGWALLAKDMAPYTRKPYLFMLKPVITSAQNLIKSLSLIKDELNVHDLILLDKLKYKLQDILLCLDKEESLSMLLLESDYLFWIEELFTERWQKVADTIDDYTFYTGGINAPWVSCAKELSPYLHKPYLLLLIPILANNDPNNFARLKRVPDARSIFLSNDNSWHRLLSLYASGIFGIEGKLKKARFKPLTLIELRRIRSKRGNELAFKTNNGNNYLSFWDYVKREVAPTWHINGGCFTYLLPYLLEIIEKYTETTIEGGNLASFKIAFKYFADYLATCFVTDINNFYGANIHVKGKDYFLVEILLDCMEENSIDLDLKLSCVARWICMVDPALVSQKEILTPAYEGLKVGPNFDLLFLEELIIALNVQDTNVLKGLHNQLLNDLALLIKEGIANKKEVPVQLINEIKDIYALRWEKVIDTKLDYMRHIKNPANEPWIRLAQYLAGARYIKLNYYKLLIPSLRLDFDRVTKEILTVYPLSKYILSTNGEELIFLPNCIAHYKEDGTFFNCNYREPMPLKSREIERLEHADPEIFSYFKRIEEKIDDLPISKKTWDEIYKLVCGTLVVEGLTSPQIGKEDYEIATRCYDKFVVYVNELPIDEKNKLYRHRILLRSRKVSVQEILDLIQMPNYDWRVCIVGQAEFFLKLLLDYAPGIKISYRIEQRLNIAGMRAHSAKKIYSDYNDLTEEEAMRRILIMISSLMTHPFQCIVLTGNWISFANHENKVTDTGKEIFSLIQKYLDKGDFKNHARFLYVQILEHIVIPALANNNWLRYQDTYEWLTKIINESLFDDNHKEFFNPEFLLTNLWSMSHLYLKFNNVLELFLDNLHEILISTDNYFKKWIKINIKFFNFINGEELAPYKSSLLQTLRIRKDAIPSSEKIFTASKEFLIHRLAQLGSLNYDYKAAGLFGRFPGDYKKVYDYFKKDITNKLILYAQQNNEINSLQTLIIKLKLILVSSKKRDLESIDEYLNQFIQQMPVITEEQSSLILCTS